MAAISAVFGGSLGFLCALIGLAAFQLTAAQALLVWSGTGLGTLLALMILARLPRAASPVRA
jgi:hypothetical protein